MENKEERIAPGMNAHGHLHVSTQHRTPLDVWPGVNYRRKERKSL